MDELGAASGLLLQDPELCRGMLAKASSMRSRAASGSPCRRSTFPSSTTQWPFTRAPGIACSPASSRRRAPTMGVRQRPRPVHGG
jgi:hypothetical protein